MIAKQLEFFLFVLWSIYDSAHAIENIGPQNITRNKGDVNVYIPCPFSGSNYPIIWKINNSLYDVSSLPDGFYPSLFGVLISRVDSGMNRTTFQCFSPTGVKFGILSSLTGTLYVRDSTGYDRVAADLVEYSPSPLPLLIELDHQRMIFTEENVTISWIDTTSDNCIGKSYVLTAMMCNHNNIIMSWSINANKSSITIPSNFLTHGRFSELSYFKLSAINNSGETCGEVQGLIAINVTDITVDTKVPPNGFCLNISSYMYSQSFVSIVLPTHQYADDCICPVFIIEEGGCFDLKHCRCTDNVIIKLPTICQWNDESPPKYHVCFENITSDLNDKIIHFNELNYLYCSDEFDRLSYVTEYIDSFRILVVLPNNPEIYYNETNNPRQISFSSNHNGDIQVDTFTLIIKDVTDQAVIATNITQSYYDVGDLFQDSDCSPFSVTVQARNKDGYTETEREIIGNRTGDDCLCIKKKIFPDLKTEHSDEALIVYINCSQTYYVSDVPLKVIVQHHDGDKMDNQTTSCGQEFVNFDNIKCGLSYTIRAHWFPEDGQTIDCELSSLVEKYTCPESKFNSNNIIWIIALFCVIAAFCLCLLIVIISCEINRRILSKRLQDFELN